jgi:hypothetical protein
MIDICVTALIKNADPYKPNFGSQKWSTVLNLDHFDRVHNIAKAAFEYMDGQGHYVPEINRRGLHGITMAWADEERIVTIVLEPGKFSYRWGRQGVVLPTYTKEVQGMLGMLDLFSKYLNRTIEVTHDAAEGDIYSLGSGACRHQGPDTPFSHDKDRECGCEKS